jgi:hypothetical protein
MPPQQWEVAKSRLLKQSIPEQIAYLEKLNAFYKAKKAAVAPPLEAKQTPADVTSAFDHTAPRRKRAIDDVVAAATLLQEVAERLRSSSA